MSKIQKDHLNRAAYIYVRQSSLAQVEQNLESQRRQYALAERAKDLGWQDIRVIDEDLGRSGSGRVERRGFEALLSEVCQGRAGAVFAIEASRFARNGHDWHRLLDSTRENRRREEFNNRGAQVRRRVDRRSVGWLCRRGGRRLRVCWSAGAGGRDGGGSGYWRAGRTG